MRILLLADIHANWPALAAIQEPHDVCLVLGDIVEYAADPLACIDWVREHGTVCIRGNHDHALAQRVEGAASSGFRRLAQATRQQHLQVLRPDDFKFLSRLPVTRTLTLDEQVFHLVHATPRDPLDEYLLDQPEAWAQRLEGIQARFVCVGHTHVPMQIDLGQMQVINPGSVGQPRDGDPRAAYAIIEKGVVQFKRVEYDISATIDQMHRSGLPADLVDWAGEVLKTGGRPPGTLCIGNTMKQSGGVALSDGVCLMNDGCHACRFGQACCS